MKDSQIIELYWTRSENAIQETEAQYGRYFRYIANSILNNDADAEEIVNDTYIKAWNTIPPARPKALKGYLGRLCRQLALDRYDHLHAEKRGGGQVPLVLEELSECLADPHEDYNAEIDLKDVLERFLKTLPTKTRRMFLRRYWYLSSVSEIAKEFGISESGVTVLMLRTRQKLKEFLQKEDFEV